MDAALRVFCNRDLINLIAQYVASARQLARLRLVSKAFDRSISALLLSEQAQPLWKFEAICQDMDAVGGGDWRRCALDLYAAARMAGPRCLRCRRRRAIAQAVCPKAPGSPCTYSPAVT